MQSRLGIKVTALDHIVLRVLDLERSLAFYRDLLGLEVEFHDDYLAGRRPFVSLRAGSQLIDLVPDPSFAPAPEAMRGFVHLCLRLCGCSLEELLAELRRQGAEILGDSPRARMGATGMGRSIYARDPDGYVVELKEEG